MVRRRLVPGVITRWRVPRTIQVARTQDSRLRWVSSSASTTASPDSSASWGADLGAALLSVGSPLATSRGRRQQAISRTRRCRVRWLTAGRLSRCHRRGMVHALGWASSRPIRWASRGPAQAGPARVGPVRQAELALAGGAVDPAADGTGVVAEQLGDGRR